ncbi:DUF4249 family protein [Leeuwenhoekiella aequorea]|uniref:DUF4249 domain-containing protein n=1 Tax=Leeuwenhoekiella aequorea TaxID=283736 RepID=A0A4Q0P8Z4_9FLAO|nr:DUF4249 family protein [Leeuwenhoekiella aequorea]RXG23204.1 putative protein DUF4249 [Leeuwenhoekiella aequorea]
MQSISKFLLASAFLLLAISCQETIDVDLPQTEERLVVDALMRIPNASTTFVEASLRLSLTTGFFESTIPTIDDALVTLDSASEMYTLTSNGNGFYSAMIPRDQIEQDLMILRVYYNDEIYTATARYITAVPIESLEQGDGSLFSGDETEVIVTYTDTPNQDNYYLFDLDQGEYLTSEDTFYKGQRFSFSYFYEDLEPQDTLNIELIGITKPFFDYMSIVINQSGTGSGNPFAAPPTEVRGNVTNETNEANYPLGYFAIGEVYTNQLIIE